jgi:hypothetical protein
LKKMPPMPWARGVMVSLLTVVGLLVDNGWLEFWEHRRVAYRCRPVPALGQGDSAPSDGGPIGLERVLGDVVHFPHRSQNPR